MVQSQFRTYNELKASTFKPTTRLPAETLWAILQNVMLYYLMNQSAGVQGHSHNLRNTEAALSNPENKPQMLIYLFYIHLIYLGKYYCILSVN